MACRLAEPLGDFNDLILRHRLKYLSEEVFVDREEFQPSCKLSPARVPGEDLGDKGIESDTGLPGLSFKNQPEIAWNPKRYRLSLGPRFERPSMAQRIRSWLRKCKCVAVGLILLFLE